MKITEYIKSNILYLDGGMGTLLQGMGLMPGELPERWNITHPDKIKKIHLDYYNAGSNVVSTNTFGANSLKFSKKELEDIISAAVKNARDAAREAAGGEPRWVALDIGPTGRMLKPYGDFDFEDAVSVFSETVRLGAKYGVDLIFIETMSDSYETKAALLAAKESSNLPIFVSNAYGEDGKLMTGASPSCMVAMLEGLGADAIGANCSLGPSALSGAIEEYIKYSSLPIILKPNAGLPRMVDGSSVYDISPDEFARQILPMVEAGVGIVGGCCGTTPDYIRALRSAIGARSPKPIEKKNFTLVSSYTHAVEFGNTPILIGERINPTGKPKFKEALRSGDISYILKEGISEEEHGAHILDVNVGLPEIDECAMLLSAVTELQSVTNLPLQIDTSNPRAMESALRRYNGKAMINSVNGKAESMDAVFPLAKKYGGVVVALTLDEDGIPENAEGRVKIAKKILSSAEKYGIEKKDLIFDPLALTVSADKNAARETLRAVKIIREELGAHTSLGVSNVSFGLPKRDLINSSFFTLALSCGLSAAIMNPYSAEMMKAYRSYLALMGLDDNCTEYIKFAEDFEVPTTVQAPKSNASISADTDSSDLSRAIAKGLREQAAASAALMLETSAPLDVIQNEIIPALNLVGVEYEAGRVYLPQLLMSAEAAKSAFEVIKSALSTDASAKRCAIVLATVKGDIHDIGKNIVKLLLENYGFAVIDLGRDVAPEKIADAVIKASAPIAALSALMTTTVPAMEETIRLLRERAPQCKVIVGGAVLNEEYAEKIGADKYAKDAMCAVRYAEEIEAELDHKTL